MLSKGFPRPGEVQDMNEKNDSFQSKVQETYIALTKFFPSWNIINVDEYKGRSINVPESVYFIHSDICFMVSKYVGHTITSLSRSQVEECVREWRNEKTT